MTLQLAVQADPKPVREGTFYQRTYSSERVPARVMLVEDQTGDTAFVKALLENSVQHVHELTCVERLEEAIEAIRMQRFDLILLDLNLPDSQGLDTLARLQEIGCTAPIVVLSGVDDEYTAMQAIERGAQDFLSKSILCGELLIRAIHNSMQRNSILAQVTESSLKDELTGLYNRRGLVTLASTLLRAARRLGTEISLIYIDLDGLKKINDQFGHAIGDAALNEAAEVLRTTIRDCDLACRLGGDEFALLLVGSTSISSRTFLQRLQASIDRLNQQPNRRFNLSMSCGISQYDPLSRPTLDAMMKDADEQMYAQKRLNKQSRANTEAKPSTNRKSATEPIQLRSIEQSISSVVHPVDIDAQAIRDTAAVNESASCGELADNRAILVPAVKENRVAERLKASKLSELLAPGPCHSKAVCFTRAIIVAFAYYCFGVLGMLIAISPGYAAAFWPSAGIALAAVLLWGNRMALGIWVGSGLINVTISLLQQNELSLLRPMMIGSIIACGAVLQAWGTAWSIRKLFADDGIAKISNTLTSFRSTILFLLVAAPVGCLIGATWGVSWLWLLGKIDASQYLLSWWTWWTGDANGVIMLLPVIAVSRVPIQFRQQSLIRVAIPLIFASLFLLALDRTTLNPLSDRSRVWSSYLVETVGLLLTSIFGMFMLLLSGQRAAQEQLVVERTEELAKTANRLETILNASSHTIIIATDSTGVVTLFNNGAERILGYRADEVVGKRNPAFLHVPAEVAAYAKQLTSEFGYPVIGEQAFVARVLRDGFDEKQWTYVCKDGKHLTVNLTLTAQSDIDGSLLGFVGVAQDITERKRSEERFRQVVDEAPNGMVVVDTVGAVVMSNVQAQAKFGYAKSEFDQVKFDQLFPDRLRLKRQDSRTNLAANYKSHFDGLKGDGNDIIGVRSNGEEFPVELRLSPLKTNDGEFLIATIIDISQRRASEQLVRDSQMELSDFVENSNVCMHWVDASGVIRWANKAELDFLGYTADEYVGQPISKFHADEATIQDILRRLSSGEQLDNYEARIIAKDGSIKYVSIHSSVYRVDGQFKHTRCFTKDITKRKEAEASLTKQTAELMRSNAELEQFAYVASHDLREPLRMVQSFCGLLQDRYGEHLDERGNKYLHYAVDGASRMQRLVDELLEFSRVGRSNEQMKEVSLEDIVRRVWSEQRTSIQQSFAQLEISTLPLVCADRERLQQVFQNLINNAIKFRSSLPPKVRISALKIDSFWQITVSDNGIGIEDLQIPRLFVIFQRLHTRDEYDGTGIGLALCKRIVEFHGGRIWIESKRGHGTSVHFTLPVKNSSTM
jgi:diguanylate cyclase (GGDEF)-like protein/PAS domain S-box-containing protein